MRRLKDPGTICIVCWYTLTIQTFQRVQPTDKASADDRKSLFMHVRCQNMLDFKNNRRYHHWIACKSFVQGSRKHSKTTTGSPSHHGMHPDTLTGTVHDNECLNSPNILYLYFSRRQTWFRIPTRNTYVHRDHTFQRSSKIVRDFGPRTRPERLSSVRSRVPDYPSPKEMLSRRELRPSRKHL